MAVHSQGLSYPDKGHNLSALPLGMEHASEIPIKAELVERYRKSLGEFQELLVKAAFSRKELKRYVSNQLSALVSHALETCAYYQEHYGSLAEDTRTPLDVFRAMAPLSKRTLQNHYLDIWSNDYIGESLNFWMTSGSTGEPTKFIIDEFNELSREVSFWFTQYLAGNTPLPVEPGKTLMLRISSYEGIGAWYKKMPFYNNALLWKMSVFNHPRCNVHQVITFIRHEQPPLLGGDPQAFLTLIDFWKQHYPKETRYPFAVEGITSGGTQLSPEARETIEQFFGIPVTDCYALSETSVVASQCRHGSLHIHTPVNVVEVVDAEDNILPDGEMGELLVTNLLNWAFPFLRYRTGDMGRIDTSGSCPCGSVLPLLRDFKGRKRRYFVKPDGQLFSPALLEALFVNLPLYQYQLIQQTPNRFLLRYVPREAFSDQSRQQVTNTLARLAGCPVDVSFEEKNSLHEPGVKFQDFVSLCHDSFP